MPASNNVMRKVSENQKVLLYKLLKEQPNLVTGNYNPTFTQKKAQQLWVKIAEALNDVPFGATKNWKGWRKCWHDSSHRFKNRLAIMKKYRSATGMHDNVEPEFQGSEEILNQLVQSAAATKSKHETEVKTMRIAINNLTKTRKKESLPDTSLLSFDEAISKAVIKQQPDDDISRSPTPPLDSPQLTMEEKELGIKEGYYQRKLEIMEEKLRLQEKEIEIKEKLYKEIASLCELLRRKQATRMKS